MDDGVARIIRGVRNWEELRQLEVNVRERGRLTAEIVAALKTRSTELGRSLVAEKTGLDLLELSPAEAKIVQAVSEYVAVMRQQGKYPQRTFDQLRNRGLIDAAESAVCRARPTQGFQTLVEADLEDLSYEQIVVDHPDEFSARAVWFSRRTLELPVGSESPPASTYSDTQTRTVTLIQWLKTEAASNEGVIPPYSNADAAAVLGMDDMQRYGQVHGNIQSRIDFGCFICGLPPLGLAADAPFSRAWAQQGRDWAFPVSSMQEAAQSRTWSAEDFDRVLRETERLPGQAHLSWKEALASNELGVRTWALSFVGLTKNPLSRQAREVAAERRSTWSRDELILVLDLYLSQRTALPATESVEVIALSEFLIRLSKTLGDGETVAHRSPDGVYQEMLRIRGIDPEQQEHDSQASAQDSRDEEAVWNEFASDPTRLSQVVAAMRAAVAHHSAGQLSGNDEPDITEAEEGRLLTRLHRVRERSRRLVEAAKSAALKKHGRLCCEACGFDYSIKYGSAGAGIIDVHHTRPVHTLGDGQTTRLQDLALLCANCHRVVHSSRRWLTLEQVRLAVKGGHQGK